MALTALERLDLMDSLDELIASLEGATGMNKLDIMDNMEVIMEKLGFGGVTPPPEPEPTPEPVTPPAPTVTLAEDIPQVVQDFLDGKYKGMLANQFRDMLSSIRDYVGGVISFSQVTTGADEWYRSSSYFQG